MQLPEIIITEQDSDSITRLLDVLPPAQREAVRGLEHELARAEIVDSTNVPDDVVTMNSRVVFEDVDTGKRSEAVLVYPHEAVRFNGCAVSVLAPLGTALLGLRTGQSIDWRMPSGKLRRYQVVEVSAGGPGPA
jgi:regulator of nucleoside diphosphate kinase